MVFTVQLNTCGVDWHEVTELLRLAGMAYYADDVHQQAFNRSHAVIFVFDAGKLVGTGRVISDGTYQAAMYDVAVLPAYQGKGLGRFIVQSLVGYCAVGCISIGNRATITKSYYTRQI
jgi:GNAT superfamily N-acetyltransferase